MFLKQQTNGKTADPRGQVYWSRAGQDGAPFRGQSAPLLKEEEFESLTERVWDTKIGTFNTSTPDQEILGRTLQWVLDAKMAGWVEILCRDHKWGEAKDGTPIMYQYIEWSEPYTELPSKYAVGSENGVEAHGKAIPSNRGGAPPPIM